jgi:hypothetical protein
MVLQPTVHSCLADAAQAGEIHTLNTCLSKGANIHDNVHLPLHAALRGGHLDSVRWMLEHKADVNLQQYWTETPLAVAVDRHSGECTRLLLEHVRLLSFWPVRGLLIDEHCFCSVLFSSCCSWFTRDAHCSCSVLFSSCFSDCGHESAYYTDAVSCLSIYCFFCVHATQRADPLIPAFVGKKPTVLDKFVKTQPVFAWPEDIVATFKSFASGKTLM